MDWYWLAILAILCGAAGGYLLWRNEISRASPSLDQRMQDFALRATQSAASDFQIQLDHRYESLPSVELILQRIHSVHQNAPIPEKELSRIVLTWGGYVGTVLQAKYGGNWQADSPTAGPHTYPLMIGTVEALPVIWSLQQIRRGNEASLGHRLADLARKLEATAPSTNTSQETT